MAASLGVGSQALTLYVDPTIGLASCVDYSAESRACGAGGATAYRSLNDAAASAGPDTIVDIRGTYREALIPVHSGTQAALIVFRRHGSETPTITGVDIGIAAVRREYVEVDGSRSSKRMDGRGPRIPATSPSGTRRSAARWPAAPWSKGRGVALRYAGAAPDMGAFEFGMDGKADRAPSTAPGR